MKAKAEAKTDHGSFVSIDWDDPTIGFSRGFGTAAAVKNSCAEVIDSVELVENVPYTIEYFICMRRVSHLGK